MMEIEITAREIYDAVIKLTERVNVHIKQVADHEKRLRSLESNRWPLSSMAILVSLAALVLAVFRS